MALSAEELELLNGDISDAVDPALARTQAVTNGNLVRAAEGNPDQYAEDRKLGQATGVSTDIASRNRPQLEKLQYLDELDLQALDETPVTQEWLKNDENSKIAYDDVAVLQRFERENSRTWWEAGEKAFENFGKTSLLGLGKAWDGIALAFLNEAKHGEGPGSVASMERMEERMDLTPEQRAERQIWKDEAAANREKLIGERRASMAAAEKEIGRLTPKGMTVMEESIRGGMQMAIDAGPGMLISALTRGRVNPTLGMLSAKVFGDSYATAIEEGMSHEEAKRYATIDMTIEIITERLPMKRLEKVVGDLGGATPKSWAKKFMLEELTGEQLATAGQTLNAYMHDLDEELANAKGWEEVMDIQGRRQAVTLFSTMIGGGSMAGTVKTVDYLSSREQRAMTKLMKDTNKRRGSEFDQKRLDGLISLSQASKTNERAADMFEDLVNKMDPDQQIYIDAEAIDLLDNPPEFLTEQLKDGSGGTVTMPLSQFLKEIAGDEAALEIVRPFIKTNENHQNKTEAEQEDDSEYIKAILAKAAETQETKTAADRIYEQVTEQLVATGQLSTASARQAATLVPSQVTVQYEHLKSIGYKNEDGSEVTLEQVFADIGLEIVGPEVDVGAADFINQEDVPDTQKPLVSGLSLLPGADQETVQAAAFQSPGGDVANNTQLLDFMAKKAGYKNATEYNAAVRQEDQAFDELLESPEQLMMLANNPEMALNMNIGEAYKTIAHAISNKRGLGILRDRVERDQIEDALSDATPQELTDMIAEEFQETAEVLDFPRVLKQQNLSNIELVEDRIDPAGNVLTITEDAGVLWNEQQARQRSIENLRKCLRA